MDNQAATELLALLSIDEKVALLSGRDAWRTAEIERLAVGSVKVTDGPVGARGDATTGARAVCLPASIALAASFDPGLVAELGALLGRETARKAAHVLLAPTINLARHPLGGRNFESFGEDPRLTAIIAAAYVGGVQSEGVGACGKHFVANDVEYARMTVSSQVDEDVLRENYLLPFEAVVEAGVWTLMASYPKLNGTHCSENRWLLTTVLRDEWRFPGLVMSDWGATHHPTRPVLAGLDLEMPGPPVAFGANLAAAVAAGEVTTAVLDRGAARVLDLAARAGRLGTVDQIEERSVDLAEERRLARRAAADGMVLLRNDGVLPLARAELRTVAVVGPNADPGVIQGGGSAQVSAHHQVTPVAGLAAALGDGVVIHQQGCRAHRYLPAPAPDAWVADGDGDGRPLLVEQFADSELAGPVTLTGRAGSIGALLHRPLDPPFLGQRWTGHLAIDRTGPHQFGVLAIGGARVLVDGTVVADNWTDPQPGEAIFQFGSTEVIGEVDLVAGTTVQVVVEWSVGDDAPLAGLRFGYLPPVDDDRDLDEAVALAAGADAAVVVVGLDHEWETEGHDRVMFGLPGPQDELIRRVAAVNPGTIVVINAGSPVAVPWIDDPAAVLMAWYPGQEFGAALADVLLGEREPGGRLPLTWPRDLGHAPFELPVSPPGRPGPNQVLPYHDGHLIGYRAYDRHRIEPLAPFGYGLGYTDFELGEAKVADTAQLAVDAGPTETALTVAVPVANVGARAGKCVVQAYLEWPSAGDITDRPERLFVGAAALRLEPDQETTATIAVPQRAFAHWQPGDGWVEVAGRHRLRLGTSSRHLERIVDVERPAVR